MTSWTHSRDHNFWSGLSEKAQREIKSAIRVRRVARGKLLVEQGAEAQALYQALYVVNFGLFEVRDREGRAVAEIGAGQLIGEIGFFAGPPPAATAKSGDGHRGGRRAAQ